MPWFKVDDGFGDHRKTKAIPRKHRLAAVGLWTLAGVWCSKQLQDGQIPAYMVEELGGTKVLADALVEAGLWERTEGGYVFHDWSQANPTRVIVTEQRAAVAERVRKFREKRAGPDLKAVSDT